VEGFKVASLTAISYLSKLLVTLFIIKQISMIHGPEGLGVLGNFMSLASMASTLGGGGILSGIIKYLAEYSGAVKRQQSFIGSSLLYTLIFSLITLLLGLFFIRSLTGYVFSNQDYRGFICFFLFAQLLVSLNNFSYGVVNGLGKNSAYTGFLLGGNLIAIVVAFFSIKFYGMWGAVVAIMAPTVFPFVPVFIYALNKRLIKRVRLDSFIGDSRLLAKFSLMRFGSAMCFPIVEIIVTNQIKVLLGLESAGFWQAITKLSTAYLSFFSLFLTFYFLPLISSCYEKKRVVNEVKKMMLFLGGAFFVMIVVFSIFKSLIIRSVLSAKFLPIGDLLMLQMVGDFFRVLGWVISFVVVARAKMKLYLLGEFFQGVVFVIMSHVVLNAYLDLRGVVLTYVATCFLYCLFSVLLFLKLYVKKKMIV